MVHTFGMMIVSWKSSQMHRAVWTPQFAAVVSCQNFESAGVQCAVYGVLTDLRFDSYVRLSQYSC